MNTDTTPRRDGPSAPAARPSFAELERERLAGATRRPDDRDDEDADERPDGSPDSVKDEGPLESLGKAVSTSVIDAAEDEEARTRPRPPG